MICLIVGCRPIIYWLIIVVNERELKKRAMFHNIPSIRRCPSPYIFMYTEEPACCIQYWHGESEKKRGQRFSKRGQLRHFIGHFPCRLLNCNIAYLHIYLRIHDERWEQRSSSSGRDKYYFLV